MNYLNEIIEKSMIEHIPDDVKNQMIIDQIESRIADRDIKRMIDNAIDTHIKNEVETYIIKNPKVFKKIPGLVDTIFKEQLKNTTWLKRLIMKGIQKSGIKYYLESQYYKL